MAHIFLSYRRDDSAGFAGRLADALETEFGAGSVFRDVDDIRPGEDFIQAIEFHLREVGAVLVMIGPHWLVTGAEGQRRLDDPRDFVRQEIQAALASGKPLIPLLVGGASMPSEANLSGQCEHPASFDQWGTLARQQWTQGGHQALHISPPVAVGQHHRLTPSQASNGVGKIGLGWHRRAAHQQRDEWLA